jgi:hypothetical protein
MHSGEKGVFVMTKRSAVARFAVAVVLGAAVLATAGCAPQAGPSGATAPVQQAAPPQNVVWVVAINDDQTATKSGVTFDIALELTASSSGSDPAGSYTGTATADTTTKGRVGRSRIDAIALAKSTKLSFTLQKAAPTATPSGESTDEASAPLGVENPDYTGTGSVTMKASGNGTISGRGASASGPFANTSDRQIQVIVKGSEAWLSVDIAGHTYIFKGTFGSQPK